MDEPVINEREERNAAALVAAHVPIPEWWFKHNALLTFLLNASSTTIPAGERFIVRAVEEAAQLTKDEDLKKRAQTLIHEEGAHARIHDAYNRYLDSIGLPSHRYAVESEKILAYFERRYTLAERLAACVMIEHFTATFGKQMLEVGILEGEDTDERMDRIWSWHSLEELEHRATAIDLFRDIGGGYWTRIRVAIIASVLFLIAHIRCLLGFLAAKGVLWNMRTWYTGIPYVFGSKGVYRLFTSSWIRFYLPGFHPSDIHIENRFQKQLHHYHIEAELAEYFPAAPTA